MKYPHLLGITVAVVIPAAGTACLVALAKLIQAGLNNL